MSEENYSKKYEPQSVDDLMGDVQKRTCNYLLEKRPQISLLTGSSGTGKTSIGKIYAAHILGCDVKDLGGSFYYNYINTSKSTDLWRGIIDLFPYADDTPTVYLVDETDQIHTKSQKLLNKILGKDDSKGVPENITIIFCTLNPSGLQADFLSRLSPKLHLDVPTKTQQGLYMNRIFKAEGIGVEGKYDGDMMISSDVAKAVFEHADGNLRELLDTIKAVRDGIFQIAEKENDDDFLTVLQNGDLSTIFKALNDVGSYEALSHQIVSNAIFNIAYKGGGRFYENILTVFGHGLSSNVRAKNSFHKLVVEFLDMPDNVM